MGCVHSTANAIPYRLQSAITPNSNVQYMLWKDAVNDLLAAYGGQFKDIVITVRLVILFCDGTSKHVDYPLPHNGLVQKSAFYYLRRNLVSFMEAPYCFYGDYLSFYNNVHHVKFNCIVNIVVIDC